MPGPDSKEDPDIRLCKCASRLGTVPVAAHQVVYQLWMFASFVIDSLAIAGQTLIAIALGAGRPREAREIADRLLEVRCCVHCSSAALMRTPDHRLCHSAALASLAF